jgi:hypothetical protein
VTVYGGVVVFVGGGFDVVGVVDVEGGGGGGLLVDGSCEVVLVVCVCSVIIGSEVSEELLEVDEDVDEGGSSLVVRESEVVERDVEGLEKVDVELVGGELVVGEFGTSDVVEVEDVDVGVVVGVVVLGKVLGGGLEVGVVTVSSPPPVVVGGVLVVVGVVSGF